MREGCEAWVVEDGSMVHRTAPCTRVKEVLEITPLPHPPNSPNLNPIENMWLDLKQRVSMMVPTTTNEEMDLQTGSESLGQDTH